MASFVSFFNMIIIILSAVSTGNSLSLNHYEKSCPNVELIVAKTVKDATAKDKTVPAALLRMHFHDCFIRVMLYYFIPGACIKCALRVYKNVSFPLLFHT
ncbi:hypothetical protein PIB30_032605 [Stylosanthes scabra]|uniref:peroxidase n=1 Tax=Stylosanthes scabra TaxID=79078 RepID=A0ABU6TBW9_9FABA|nr:hypothetical protein [Stylosanthes scabra]